MQIIETKRFKKSRQKLDDFVLGKMKETLQLFIQEPTNAKLKNHELSGQLKGIRSINVTGDWRILFRELSAGKYELVELLQIGKHSQLYK